MMYNYGHVPCCGVCSLYGKCDLHRDWAIDEVPINGNGLCSQFKGPYMGSWDQQLVESVVQLTKEIK